MSAEARRIAGVSDRFGDLLLGQTAADQDPLVRGRYLDLRLTGDSRAAAEAIGAKLGIDDVRAEVLPADKAEAMSSLGKTYGTDVAMHAAGVTLMRPDPRLVGAAIDISRRTYAKIRQNLFWAFVYNVVGIPLAALGILTPVIAGAAMALSSVSVVANALLLKRWKPEE